MNKKIAKTEYCNMIAVWLPVVKNCVSITWYKHRTSTSCLHKLWWFEQREITFWWSKGTVFLMSWKKTCSSWFCQFIETVVKEKKADSNTQYVS